MAATGDLVWQLVRNNSCFMKKQKNVPVMTTEPDNLTGLNAYKYSGLANAKKVGLKSGKNGEKESVTLTQSQKKVLKIQKPSKAKVTTGIKKNPTKGEEQLKKILSNSYRRDLVDAATEKYTKVLKSFKKASAQNKPNRKL